MSKLLEQWRTEFRLPVATVLKQESDKLSDGLEMSAVDHAAAMPLHREQSRSGQDGEVGGQCIVGHLEETGHLPCRQTGGLMLHKQPECIQPGRLSKS